MHLFSKSKNKIYSIIVSILLVIQPLAANNQIQETIETRPPYTNYGAFLSSDYMMKRLKYSPEHESRMNSNEWVLNSANRSGTTIFGENVNLKIKDSIILDGGVTANNKLNIDTQGNLSSTAELKSKGDMSINAKGELNQTGGGIKALNLNIYTGGDLNLTGTKIKVDETINLNSDKSINLNAQRQIDSGIRGNITWQNSQDIATTIEANKNIKLNAKDDINLTASTIESKGSSVALKADDEINIEAGENYQEFAYSNTSTKKFMGGLKKKTTTENHHEQHLTHTQSAIKGRNGVDLTAQNNITVEGSTLSTRNGDINIQTQGDVTFKAVQDKHLVEHSSNTSKSFAGIKYGKAGSSSTLNQTINQGSISDALGNIDSKAGGVTTLEASKLKAGGNININSKNGIQILSAQDTTDYEAKSSSSSFGSLLSKEQKESLQKALTVSSLIDAKTVNLETSSGVIIKGSQIQATTVNFMASFLTLISDKNSESYSSFSDGSGVLTRTIINQGYVKETAVAAEVNAQEITLNGKTLLEDKLKPENLLKQLSSEYNLNEAQINQVKAELTNKEWYDKTTTLSQMGMIIVQAIATIATAGTATALVGAMEAGMTKVMVSAAINSLASQIVAQLATAAITGNKLDLDINTLLTNSLKAAALAGLTAQIDTNLGLDKEKLSFAEKSTKQILHGIAQKAVYGGSLESILATSAGNVAFDYIGHSVYSNDSQFPQLRDAIPKTVIHSLVGGTLAELAGGDFSQGAIATATSHTVAEYIDNNFVQDIVNDKMTQEQADAYIKAISSVVSGAAVLATHENVTNEELKIAQDLGQSVVEYNNLKALKAVVNATKKLKEVYSKKGTISVDDLKTNLKDVGKEEALSILENVIELTNDKFTSDDVFATLDLLSGIDFKSADGKVKVASKAQELYTKVFGKTTFNTKDFKDSLVNLPSGERVAKIKETAKDFATQNGWKKDNRLSTINGRDVFVGKDGKLYSLDTQHGDWEKINPKNGQHEGSFDLFDINTMNKSIDYSGNHNLKVK